MTDASIELEVTDTLVVARCYQAGEKLITFGYPTNVRVDLDMSDFEGRTLREEYMSQARDQLASYLDQAKRREIG